MSTDPFNRQKRPPGCLSQRIVSLFVIGELEAEQHKQTQAHLAECQPCSRRVEHERQQVEDTRLERIPQAVLAAAEQGSGKSFHWQWATALAGAAAAILALVIYLPGQTRPTDPAGGVRIKGRVDLLASVERNGQRIADSVPIEKLPAIRSGDAFRLKVAGNVQARLALRACEQQTCTLLYKGGLPPSGWLPLGLTATTGDSRLELIDAPSPQELRACLAKLSRIPAASSSLNNCTIHAFELTVGPEDVP